MMTKSKRLPFYIAGGAGVSALAAALGLTLSSSTSSASPVSATPSATMVQTRATSLGQVLVDAQGRTMYLFEQDNGTMSTCTGSCTSVWPPVPVSGAPTVSGGASATAVGVATEANGVKQLTYAGHPLYYFAGDGQPGQTRGQAIDEFGAKWYALDSSGAAVTAGTATPPSSGNNLYGY
jgi:predicted lipoprotein with Yx(FWY)xxD motif